jgi:hypothetical protein
MISVKSRGLKPDTSWKLCFGKELRLASDLLQTSDSPWASVKVFVHFMEQSNNIKM